MKRRRFRAVVSFVLVFFSVCLGGYFAAKAASERRTLPKKRFLGTILSYESDLILQRACFDCHSNETIYPWYSSIPVIRERIDKHVATGREALNFSEWDVMSSQERISAIDGTLESIYTGQMPLSDYLTLHPEAELSNEDFAQIQTDAVNFSGFLNN